MEYVIFDLEWNGAYNKKIGGYFNEIIEIGAVKMNAKLKITDTMQIMIKPAVSKRLSAIVKNLTHLENKDLMDGVTFDQAVKQFSKWTASSDCLIMSWGTTDLLVLLENCKYFYGVSHIPFLKNFTDLQQYCQIMVGTYGQNHLGLVSAANLLHIDIAGAELHRALDDSKLSAAVFKKIYMPSTIEDYIKDATKTDFYERLTHKNSILSDIKNPLVRKSDLYFTCPLCGGRLKRLQLWMFKGRAFRSRFHCSRCKLDFAARVQIKTLYDGVTVKRTIKEITEPSAAPEKLQ